MRTALNPQDESIKNFTELKHKFDEEFNVELNYILNYYGLISSQQSQSGGFNNVNYKNKYLKYKNKYLQLKKIDFTKKY